MARTKDETIREVTEKYLESLDIDNPPAPADIKADILDEIRIAFDTENANRPKGDKWKYVDKLIPAQIADILLALYPIVNVACAGVNADREYDILSIYQSSGDKEGIYISGDDDFFLLSQEYCYSITSREVQEVINILKHKAPRKTRCSDRSLVAVNNGIFDYDTKELMPFDPSYVFIAKSRVNYNDQATNVIIHNDDDNTDWDVESWMDELFDDKEIRDVIWQVLGAIIRPNVSWNKSAWFYSESGNNGKGTLCELMRQLCGDGSYASITLADFSKDFMLEPLTRATAIITDENDVGTYIDKAANLKSIITNDTIQMNRKFKTPIAYQFRGFMVQCLNEMPRIKDKSDSFYRRQLFIPFTKCFTGKERKYIKNDYLHRPEVLEYVLYKVLNMNYYTLSEPQACKDALDTYKEFNDPVRQFIDDVVCEATWDLLPFNFLYDVYKVWFKENSPSGSVQGKNTFINDIVHSIQGNSEWYCLGATHQIRTAHYMDANEPLATKYNLPQWQRFDRMSRTRGLLRVSTQASGIPVCIEK